ncbi:MAG: DNA gyrase subunit A [Gemmatimonadota bacterium]|nr:MAG: DNA gyrase subunit A [Gemmatimonadota bacterium]
MVKVENPRRERIVERFLEEELRESFIDYSMSVIVQRALPDARDGLKPVQRRILFAMHELGLAPEKAHKKSATVVGDVLGKYHPHGDVTVYDTLVRMAQPFSMRCLLVDGQGNFGSIDGDPAAAYRYTEARLAHAATDLLRDIDKDTVDFRPNFDGRLQEPEVLPAAFPQLLVNGSDGIAVGMATKIPPHNLREMAAAAEQLLARPNTSVKKLLEIVSGPDFPTGAYIWGREGIEEAYRTGRGRVVMRARAHVEPGAYGKPSLVITELPYQVSKQRVIEAIVGLARNGKLAGLTDLRDESDRDGVRIVLELKRDANPRKILEKLFLKTQLQTTFGVILLALVDGVPRQLNLKEALEVWIAHRLAVIVRRTRYNLKKAKERAHILDGLLVALDQIDEVVKIIKSSRTPETASKNLRSALKISALQASAILAMRLSRLTNLETRALKEEHDQVARRIKTLQAILADEKRQRDLVRRELGVIAERYGDARRTEILDGEGRFPLPTGDAEQEMHVFLTHWGYLKALPARSAAGDGGLAAAESLEEQRDDFVTRLWLCKSEDQLLAFAGDGQVYATRVGDLPQGTRSSRGNKVRDLLGLDEAPAAVHAVRDFSDDRFVVIVTRKGRVKKTALSEYRNIRSGGIIAASIEKGDEIVDVHITDGQRQLVVATRKGQVIRFDESEVRPMGRNASGVKGIALARGDQVTAFVTPRRDSILLGITADGYAKAMGVDDLRAQSRGGKGVHLLPPRLKAGDLVGFLDLLPHEGAVALTQSGDAVRLGAPGAGNGGRANKPIVLPLRGRKLTAIARSPIQRQAKRAGDTQMSLQI